MRFLLCCVAVSLVGVAPAYARSHKKPAGTPRIGMLFLSPPPQVSPKITKAFRKEIVKVSAQEPSFVLVGEPEITRALHKDPRRFLRTCGKELRCLLGIIRKAKIDSLLLGRWVNPDDPTLQYAIINGAENKVTVKGSLPVASAREAAQAARDNFAKLFGLEAAEEAPPPPMPPEEPVAQAPPPSTAAPAPAVSAAPTALAPSVQAEPEKPSKPIDRWFVSSLAVLGAGVGLAATGGYFAYHGHQLANSVTVGVTPQPQLISTLNQANNAITTGNILLITGSAVGVVGAALLTLHELNIVGAKPDAKEGDAGSGGHAALIPLRDGLDVTYMWAF